MKFPSVATNRKLVTSTEINKKISDMTSVLQGFWAADRWDIRICPHPSAIELSKNPSLKNRWVNFDKVENIWLKTELKYFYYVHLNNGTWNAKSVWIRKGTVISRMLGFLNLNYPDITSITEVPIKKALSEYRTYLAGQGVRTTTTNYKLDINQKKFLYMRTPITLLILNSLWSSMRISILTAMNGRKMFGIEENFHYRKIK